MMQRCVFLLLLLSGTSLLGCRAQEPCPGMEFKQFFHDNGQVSSEGCWRNDAPEGVWKNYDPQGNLISEGARENFQLTGVWTFYQNGRKTSEIRYENGRKNGVAVSYLPERTVTSFYRNDTLQGLCTTADTTGKILKTTPFRNGLEHGLEKHYGAGGDVRQFVFYREGLTVFKENGNLRDAQGRRQGRWKDFYANGNLHWECIYKDDLKNGYYKLYDSTGNLVSLEKYVEDVLQQDAPEIEELSIHTEYYANGNPKFRVAMKNGKPEGLCRQYDSLTGKVVRGIVFHNGEVLGSEQVDEYGNKKSEEYEEYYPDGKLKCAGRLYKGKRYGKWKFYFPDGRLEQEGEYHNGLAEGTWLWYYPDGGLRREQEYRYGKLDGISVEYDDSARVVAKGRYSDDLEDGHWEYFRQGEVTQGEYRFGEKEGLWKSYWTNDGKKRLSFQGYYTGGFPDGRHQYFDEEGILKQEGYFRQGKRVGTWIKYDRTGQPEMRILYDNREEETRYNGRRTVSREQEKAFREEDVRLAE